MTYMSELAATVFRVHGYRMVSTYPRRTLCITNGSEDAWVTVWRWCCDPPAAGAYMRRHIPPRPTT